MSDIAIRFENVGKLYRLGTVGTGWLSHDIKRWWITSVLHKEDPYLKIGETNDRSSKGHSDYVYALKDITFDVKQGEVLGIIGKNGAGKSTLLKLLSRVTYPTAGNIYVKGRIASLLEVGTGFHPELTGRENIYMNGSILGMKKHEIDRKLDEIVDFSGCERYLDTPVKRYSSGMMVRLGFAVAAHLEPEILVVDEVLAVGDAEFQKKAIGKMQDVSKGEGRTVLFVSHNMASIRALCSIGVLLEDGTVKSVGEIDDVVDVYLNGTRSTITTNIRDNIQWLDKDFVINDIRINNTDKAISYISGKQEYLNISISGKCENLHNVEISIIFRNEDEVALATCALCENSPLFTVHHDFSIKADIILPDKLFNGAIKLDIFIHEPNVSFIMKAPSCCVLDIEGYQYKYGQVKPIKRAGLMALDSIIR